MGIENGNPKIIKNIIEKRINDESVSVPLLKDVTVRYLEKIRQRFRDRDIERTLTR